MKIPAMEQTESISDVLCDVCGDSTRIEGYGLQFGTLRASWGYGSTHDGERYEVHLCEPCFFRTISGLRRERRPRQARMNEVSWLPPSYPSGLICANSTLAARRCDLGCSASAFNAWRHVNLRCGRLRF